MVEKISSILTQRMVNENIISVNEYDYYHYKLLVYCEFIVGHSVLLLVALCFRFALRAIVFLFVFNLLRGYTNGYHCETNIGCVTLSVCVLLWIRLHESIILEKWTIYQGGVILSMIFIIIIGSVNHPNMNLSAKEFRSVSKKARITVVLLTFFFFILNFLNIEKIYLYYFGMGILQTFISMILAQMIMKGGVVNE